MAMQLKDILHMDCRINMKIYVLDMTWIEIKCLYGYLHYFLILITSLRKIMFEKRNLEIGKMHVTFRHSFLLNLSNYCQTT